MPSEPVTAEPDETRSVDAAPALLERPRLKGEELIEGWHGVSRRASSVLREPSPATFVTAVQRIDDEICSLLEAEAERSLLLLIHSAGAEPQRYSVMHALLVTVVCELAARLMPDCSDDSRRSLRLAALTMNVGMTRLQDQLALQDGPLTVDQRTLVDGHAVRSQEMLGEMGVTDPLWLDAVLHHHDAPPGALAERPDGMQLARMIQRSDLFAARMSPRKLRAALSANVAAKGAYFDEQKQPDQAGSLIIKALGIYPAGSYVQLASGELAVVLRRGTASNKPLVAAIADGHGSPYVQPSVRATDTKITTIVRGVPPKEVRVRVPMERLLKLAK